MGREFIVSEQMRLFATTLGDDDKYKSYANHVMFYDGIYKLPSDSEDLKIDGVLSLAPCH